MCRSAHVLLSLVGRVDTPSGRERNGSGSSFASAAACDVEVVNDGSRCEPGPALSSDCVDSVRAAPAGMPVRFCVAIRSPCAHRTFVAMRIPIGHCANILARSMRTWPSTVQRIKGKIDRISLLIGHLHCGTPQETTPSYRPKRH